VPVIRLALTLSSAVSSMKRTFLATLLARIDTKDWWYVPQSDPCAYQARGKFLASAFRAAEFWVRPSDTPIRVRIKNPIVGAEMKIETELLGAPSDCTGDNSAELLEWRER
jgi:hypothetical protein